MTRPRPPALARRLVLVLAPPDDAGFIVADLDDGFAVRARAWGGAAARRWYWSQTLRALPALARSRAADLGRSAWRPGPLGTDVRAAGRALRRSPGFTLVAGGTLALGIGAATILGAAVDAVLFQPLPVRAPERLVLLSWSSETAEMAGSVDDRPLRDAAGAVLRSRSFPTLAYRRFEASARGAARLFAFARIEQLDAVWDDGAEIVTGQVVSGGYHATLGVEPALGRLLGVGDDGAAPSAQAVISHAYWVRRFGADPSVVGRGLSLNGVPFTVVGVTPPAFSGTLELGEDPDVTVPLALEPALRPGDSNLDEPWNWWLFVMARLEGGASAESLAPRLAPVLASTAREGWNAMPPEARARPEFQGRRALPELHVAYGGRGLASDDALWGRRARVLACVVAALLLIACGNVTSLLLARSQARRADLAIHRALGASRGRVVRRLVLEGLLLGLGAGLAGAGLAWVGRDGLLAWLPMGSGAAGLRLAIDARLLALTTALAVATGAGVGTLPALVATGPQGVVRGSGQTEGRAGVALRSAITAGQVGLSFVLLTVAGLLVGTLRNLEHVDLGFDTAGLLTFRVDPRLGGYRGADIGALYERMVERLEALPRVRSVTLSRHALLAGSYERAGDGWFLRRDDGEVVEGSGYVQRVRWNFPEAMAMRVVNGRALGPDDDGRAPRVALVNEAFVRRYVGASDPLGVRFGFGSPDDDVFEIVGVLADAVYATQREPATPTAYIPYTQAGVTQVAFALRASGDRSALVDGVREAVRQVDPALPIFDVRTSDELARARIATERRLAWLSTAVGVVALLLTSLALYGSLAYRIARQAPEIGIRIALGARRAQVVGSVVRHTAALVAAGLVGGTLLAALTGRLVEAQLFQIDAGAPGVRLMAATVLFAVALLAAYAPARRAAGVDPVRALRDR